MTNTSVASPQLDPFHCLLSSHDMGWKGILVEQYQSQLHQSLEGSFSALSAHWLNFYSTKPFHLTQKQDDRLHKSFTKCRLCPIVHNSDLVFVSAGQTSYTKLNGVNDRLAPPLGKGRLGGVSICRFNSLNWYYWRT
jgi:hypothetical protein